MRIEELRPDEQNSNRGTERGNSAIQKSIERFGLGRSVVVDRNGKLIAGNKTHLAAVKAGITKVRVVETEGDELIVHQRNDLDLDDDPRARGLAISDNRATEISQNIDREMVENQIIEMNLDPSDLEYTIEELRVEGQGSGVWGQGSWGSVETIASEAVSGATSGGGGGGGGSGGGRSDGGTAPGDGLGVFVQCKDETDQKDLYERMTKEGRVCKLSFM